MLPTLSKKKGMGNLWPSAEEVAFLANAQKQAAANDVAVDVNQSVKAKQSFEVKAYDDIIVKAVFSKTMSVSRIEDVSICSTGGDINGALVDIDQCIDIYQYSQIFIDFREKNDTLLVNIRVQEKTTVTERTDIDVLLTDDGQFDVDTFQTINLTQDSKITITGAPADIDLDILLAQTAVVEQHINVAFEGTPDDFTIAIDAQQSAVLNQQVLIGISPLDLGLAA